MGLLLRGLPVLLAVMTLVTSPPLGLALLRGGGGTAYQDMPAAAPRDGVRGGGSDRGLVGGLDYNPETGTSMGGSYQADTQQLNSVSGPAQQAVQGLSLAPSVDVSIPYGAGVINTP